MTLMEQIHSTYLYAREGFQVEYKLLANFQLEMDKQYLTVLVIFRLMRTTMPTWVDRREVQLLWVVLFVMFNFSLPFFVH